MENGTSTVPLALSDDLELLLLIRRFEEKLLDLFGQGKLNGTTHTCIGQEHVPVALMPLLNENDFIFSNHRGHGHYLARFRDPEGLLAEIMGREGSVCNGVGGSQHIRRGRYFSTGIQGESLPVGVGTSLACKRAGKGEVTVCFIGDGTWGQGAVYEALNLAALLRTPLIVAVENNEIAQTTPRSVNMAGSIKDRAAAFGIPHYDFKEVNPIALREQLIPLVLAVREGSGPVVFEFAVPRLGPHSKGDDTRSSKELDLLWAADWYRHFSDQIPERVDQLDVETRKKVEALVREVESRPFSSLT